MKRRRGPARLAAGIMILSALGSAGAGGFVRADAPEDEAKISAVSEPQIESSDLSPEAVEMQGNLEEAVSLPGCYYAVESTGTYFWVSDEIDGRPAARSGNRGVNSSESVMTLSVTVTNNTKMGFSYLAPTESGDICEFYLDNKRKFGLSSDTDWKNYTATLHAGKHTLEWKYTKDESGSVSPDAFYVRNLFFGSEYPVAAIYTADDSLEVPLNAYAELAYEIVPDYVTNKNVTVTAADSSVVTVQSMDGGYRLYGSGTGTTTVTIQSQLNPETKKELLVTVADTGRKPVELYGITENAETDGYALMKVTGENVQDPECIGAFPFMPDCMTYADGAICGFADGTYFRADINNPHEIRYYRDTVPERLGIVSVDALCRNADDGMLYGAGRTENGFVLLRTNPCSGATGLVAELDPGYLTLQNPEIEQVFGITDGPDGRIRTVATVKYEKQGVPQYDRYVFIYDFSSRLIACRQVPGYDGQGKDSLVYDHDQDKYWDAFDGIRSIGLNDNGGEWLGGNYKLYSPFIIPRDASGTDRNPFDDVKAGKYYYDAVLWAYNANPQITKGKSTDSFAPKADCRRQEVVTFLWRLAGCPEPTLSENPFADVMGGSPYYKAILWAYEKGITTGTTETTFDPKGTCSRRDFVTFLWRAYGEPAHQMEESPFVDVQDASRYWYNPIMWAAESGITTGKYPDQNLFATKETLNRGEVVTFIFRAYLAKGRP